MAGDDAEIPLQQIEGEHVDNNIPVEPGAEERVAYRVRDADRYRLKASTFTGEEEVEQFIQEFGDVIEVTQWPPWAALLKLRLSMMDKAKPYGLGPGINSIFASLRARFGISAIDARAILGISVENASFHPRG